MEIPESFPVKLVHERITNGSVVSRLVSVNNIADYQKYSTFGTFREPTDLELRITNIPGASQPQDSTSYLKAQAELTFQNARQDVTITFTRPTPPTEEDLNPEPTFIGTLRLHKQWQWEDWQGKFSIGKGTIWFSEEGTLMNLSHEDMQNITEMIAQKRQEAFMVYWSTLQSI